MDPNIVVQTKIEAFHDLAAVCLAAFFVFGALAILALCRVGKSGGGR